MKEACFVLTHGNAWASLGITKLYVLYIKLDMLADP